eukprot:RCo017388
MLAYKGMAIFPPVQNPSTSLWIQARYLESVAVLVATLLHRQICARRVVLYGFLALQALAVVLALVSVFEWNNFPKCYDDPTGTLTQFKKDSEYIVCAIWVITALLVLRMCPPQLGLRGIAVFRASTRWLPFTVRRFCRAFFSVHAGGEIPAFVRNNILLSVFFTIATELILTFYKSLVGWELIVGHSCKVMAFYFIYKAMVRVTLTEPYTYLFNDLTRMNMNLALAGKAAEAAMKDRTDVMVWLSNEIRAPFEGINTVLRGLRETALTEKQRMLVDVLDGTAANLMAVVNDVLDFFKLDAGNVGLQVQPTSLAEVVRGVLSGLDAELKERGVAPTIDISPSLPPTLLCDPTRVRQVLSNLISNSVKFSKGGLLKMRVAHQATGQPGLHQVSIEVTDTGMGADHELRQQLLSPIPVLQGLSSAMTGPGLGLVVVRQFVELMGGMLELTSDPGGHGSTVCVTLPLRQPLTGSGLAAQLSASNESEHLPMPPSFIAQEIPLEAALVEPMRLLVAEDNTICRAVMAGFARRLNCAVDFISVGPGAVQQFTEGTGSGGRAHRGSRPRSSSTNLHYDLIFLDLTVDREGAAAVARELRELRVMAPIVGLAGETGPTDEFGEIPVSEVLRKPVTYAQLVTSVRRWVPVVRSGIPDAPAQSASGPSAGHGPCLLETIVAD